MMCMICQLRIRLLLPDTIVSVAMPTSPAVKWEKHYNSVKTFSRTQFKQIIVKTITISWFQKQLLWISLHLKISSVPEHWSTIQYVKKVVYHNRSLEKRKREEGSLSCLAESILMGIHSCHSQAVTIKQMLIRIPLKESKRKRKMTVSICNKK